jgi:glycogen operon protein
LYDLFSYNDKHNEANGENNNDGANDNNSWNCGWEGETDDPEINSIRRRQIKNALTILLLSQGVPMILMGDEGGRTQNGNNNAYCHDTEMNWFDWSLLEKNADLFRYAKSITHFRHAHPVLRNRYHFQHRDYVGSGYPDISFHGTQAWNCDWSFYSRVFAFLLCGKHAKQGTSKDDFIYVAMNMYWDALNFQPPSLPEGTKWHIFANTSMPTPEDIHEIGQEPILENQTNILAGPRSIFILVGR